MYPINTGESILAEVHLNPNAGCFAATSRFAADAPTGTPHKAHSLSCDLGSRWREEAKVGGDFQEIGDRVQESRASQLAPVIWLIVANSFLCVHLCCFSKHCNIRAAKITQIFS